MSNYYEGAMNAPLQFPEREIVILYNEGQNTIRIIFSFTPTLEDMENLVHFLQCQSSILKKSNLTTGELSK